VAGTSRSYVTQYSYTILVYMTLEAIPAPVGNYPRHNTSSIPFVLFLQPFQILIPEVRILNPITSRPMTVNTRAAGWYTDDMANLRPISYLFNNTFSTLL
jgi:hypothetical protein